MWQLDPPRLDFRADGYHRTELSRKQDPPGSAKRWSTLTGILNGARRGDFTPARALRPLLRESDDPLFRVVCAQVAADVAPSFVLHELWEDLEGLEGVRRSPSYCVALADWGNLSVVPLLLREYAAYHGFIDFRLMPLWVSQLLESVAGPLQAFPDDEGLEQWIELANMRYCQLRDELGTDDICVLLGRPMSVRQLVEVFLERCRTGTHPTTRLSDPAYLRRRFEAATGLPCRAFFERGEFRPLAAAAVLEDWLEGDDLDRFIPGVRYFFGRRVPDT